MKYAYRTPKVLNLQPLLNLLRSKGVGYDIFRFRGERANRSFSVISIGLEHDKWDVRPQTLALKGEEELEFLDLRFSRESYKKFHEYMMEVKAEAALPHTYDTYLEQLVKLSKDVLLVSILEENDRPRRIGNPLEDWAIRTDRLLKAKALLLKRAEGEAIEEDMTGVPAEEVPAILSVTEDVAIEQKFIKPMLDGHRLSHEIMQEKIKLFKGHRSGFDKILKDLDETYSSQGEVMYGVLQPVLLDASTTFAGSLLEKYVAQHKVEPSSSLPDFIFSAEIEQKDAKFYPSGKRKKIFTYEADAWDIYKRVIKNLQDWLEVNGENLGLSIKDFDKVIGRDSFWPGYATNLEWCLQFIKNKINSALSPKLFHVEGLEKKQINNADYLTHLKELNAILGGHSDVETEIALAEKKGFGFTHPNQIPTSILELNKTEHQKQISAEDKALFDSLQYLTPQALKEFTFNEHPSPNREVKKTITSPQYPGFQIVIVDDWDRPVSTHIEGIFYAMKILSIYLKDTTIELNYQRGRRAHYSYHSPHASLGVITMDRSDEIRVAIHETMHALEYREPKIGSLVAAFCATRYEPKNYKVLHGKERGFFGLWAHYAGKVYEDSPHITEFITMGVQEFRTPAQIALFAKKDYAHFLFCHALVTGKLKDYL